MRDYLEAERQFKDGLKVKKVQDVKKALDNFINQLKIHFDLDDNEIDRVLELLIKSRKKEITQKKWWQIWK
jgi:hemerythrin-like domain-containing protein